MPGAALLVAFGEAVLAGEPQPLEAARESLRRALGDAALVDAAAIVASFDAVVKLADGSGIPLEEAKAEATRDLRDALGLERLNNGKGA